MGGGVLYAYWVCAARETPIFSPKFPFRRILIFHKLPYPQKIKRSGASPFYFFLADFAVPEDHHFTNFFKFNPFIGSALTFGQRRGLAGRPEHQPDASWQFRRLAFSRSKPVSSSARSPHYHAQNGSSSIRSPTFSRSTGSSFRSPGHFSLCRGTYLPGNLGMSTPPPRAFCVLY